jgi:proteasome lid subunit RPN8/RPN11
VKISDTGKAANQPISHEVLEVAYQEIEQRQRTNQDLERTIQDLERTNNEQAKQIDAMQERLHNQQVTIRVLAATIATHPAAEPRASDINRLLSPNQPPMPPETANVPSEQKSEAGWGGEWQNLNGWRVPVAKPIYVEWRNGSDLYWRLSTEWGWVKAEKWQEPVAVHTPPNVRWAGGK